MSVNLHDPLKFAVKCGMRYYKWPRQLYPEDWMQEIQLAILTCGDNLTKIEVSRAVWRGLNDMMRAYGLRRKEVEITDALARRSSWVSPCAKPKTATPESYARRHNVTGYRTDPERKRAARNKVSPERRAEIARMGAMASRRKQHA